VPPIVLAAEGADGAISLCRDGSARWHDLRLCHWRAVGHTGAEGRVSGDVHRRTDGADNDVILLKLTFVVLPATGGDVADIIPTSGSSVRV
jgi:hypothetical protein